MIGPSGVLTGSTSEGRKHAPSESFQYKKREELLQHICPLKQHGNFWGFNGKKILTKVIEPQVRKGE